MSDYKNSEDHEHHHHHHGHGHSEDDPSVLASFEQMLQQNFEVTENETKNLVDSLGIQSDWNIMDVGSGTGLLAPLFLEKIQSGSGTLTLLEPSDLFTEHMGGLVEKYQGKVIHKKSSVEDKNYPCGTNENGYDLIFVRLVLHHCKADDAINTLLGYLRPGGLFVIQEFVHGTCAFWGAGMVCEALHQMELNSITDIRTHVLGEGKESDYVPPAMYHNLLRKHCDIKQYVKYVPESHPSATLGKITYDMLMMHCNDPDMKEKAKKEYEQVCKDPDSVVLGRIHIHIVAKKR